MMRRSEKQTPVFSGILLPMLALAEMGASLLYVALWLLAVSLGVIWGVLHLLRNQRIRMMRRELSTLRDTLQSILHHSREMLFKVDFPTGCFHYLSPSCFSLTGFDGNELSAMSFAGLLDRIHPEDRPKIDDLIGRLRAERTEREWLGLVEYRFRHKDGHYHSFSDHLQVSYDEEGRLLAMTGCVRDVTQATRLEESMRLIEKRFQEAQKMAGLGTLAGGIAHDFNNLMTVVLGNTELLAIDMKDAPETDSLDEIRKTALRAAELANQMLVYSGKTSPVIDRIDLGRVVREMGSLLNVSMSRKVALQYDLEETLPPVRGDVSQIRQVAMNLITNASEAIGDKEGVIAISIHSVALHGIDITKLYPGGEVMPGRYVRLEVSDTGRGMDEETKKKIFDPLFTTKITGRGLGLASLFNVMRRHNGAIDVRSEAGKGSVFRVYFPAEDGKEPVETAVAPVEEEPWRGYGTALVADDETAIRNIVSSLLRRQGFEVITAVDGQEMIDRFTERAADISVLLVDLNMPRLNGVEAVQRVRHIRPNTPVLFISGYPREQVMQQFEQQPEAVDFIKKPFQADELISAVQGVMECDPTGLRT